MATVVLPTRTTTNITNSDISVLTEYFVDDLPNTISIDVKSNDGTNEGTSFFAGDLVVQFKNPDQISWRTNSNGELIVTSSDANKYSVNSNGELIYTE